MQPPLRIPLVLTQPNRRSSSQALLPKAQLGALLRADLPNSRDGSVAATDSGWLVSLGMAAVSLQSEEELGAAEAAGAPA